MKKTVNVAIGGYGFTLEEEAYTIMSEYLDGFKGTLDESSVKGNMMEELEGRIADQLKQIMGEKEIVTASMVQETIDQIGYPEGYISIEKIDSPKKFFRDSDDKKIAGVCSGLALYFDVDVALIRVLFLIALIFCTTGFWAYIIIWIAAPEARTAAEKCALRGIPPTPDNLRRFSKSK